MRFSTTEAIILLGCLLGSGLAATPAGKDGAPPAADDDSTDPPTENLIAGIMTGLDLSKLHLRSNGDNKVARSMMGGSSSFERRGGGAVAIRAAVADNAQEGHDEHDYGDDWFEGGEDDGDDFFDGPPMLKKRAQTPPSRGSVKKRDGKDEAGSEAVDAVTQQRIAALKEAMGQHMTKSMGPGSVMDDKMVVDVVEAAVASDKWAQADADEMQREQLGRTEAVAQVASKQQQNQTMQQQNQQQQVAQQQQQFEKMVQKQQQEQLAQQQKIQQQQIQQAQQQQDSQQQQIQQAQQQQQVQQQQDSQQQQQAQQQEPSQQQQNVQQEEEARHQQAKQQQIEQLASKV